MKTNKDRNVEIIVVQNGYLVYFSPSAYTNNDMRMKDSGYVAESFGSLNKLLLDKLEAPGE